MKKSRYNRMAKSFFQDLLTFFGISNSKIIRLNADGSPDPSFTTGVGFNATVSALAIQW
jgi:hypothetical protein